MGQRTGGILVDCLGWASGPSQDIHLALGASHGVSRIKLWFQQVHRSKAMTTLLPFIGFDGQNVIDQKTRERNIVFKWDQTSQL